jgi:hypothetical protein
MSTTVRTIKPGQQPDNAPDLSNLSNDIELAFDKLEQTGELDTVIQKPDPDEEIRKKEEAEAQRLADEEAAKQDEPEPDTDQADDQVDDQVDDDIDLEDEPEDDGIIDRVIEDEDKQVDEDPVKKTRADDDDSKEDLEEIVNNPHTPEKTKKSINRLRGNINSLKKTVREISAEKDKALAELTELKKNPKAAVSEEEQHELNMLRRRYQVERDPAIKEKYDSQISVLTDELNKIVDANCNAETAASIKQMGFEAFARGYPSSYKEFIEKLSEASPYDSDIVKTNISELRNLNIKRDREVKKLTEEADTYFAEKGKEEEVSADKHRKQVELIQKFRDQTYADITTNDKHFQLLDTTGLAGETLKQAEAENSRRQKYHQQLHRAIHAKTVDEQVEVVYRAGLAVVLADRLKQARDDLKVVKGAYKKLKAARGLKKPSSDNPKPRSTAPVNTDFSAEMDRLAGNKPSSLVIPN